MPEIVTVPATGFYVYRLVDPRCGRAFYVGKGQRGRAWQHQQDVVLGRKSANAAKCRRIAEIVGFGLDVQVEIVAQYDDELDALDHEFRLVDADPTLTNVQPGGVGRTMSPKVIRWLRERRVARVLAERAKRKVEVRTGELGRYKDSLRQFLDLAEGSRSEAEVKAWVEEREAALEELANRGPRVRGKRAPKIRGRSRRARRKRAEAKKANILRNPPRPAGNPAVGYLAKDLNRKHVPLAAVPVATTVVAAEPKAKPWWHKGIPGRERKGEGQAPIPRAPA